ESEPPKEVTHLTVETLPEYVKDGNHFVKFYAPWCAHSFRLEPIWNKIAEAPEFEGKVSLARVDCDDNKSLCKDYDIKGYPTLIWLKDGKVVRKYAGTRTHRNIISFIREMINEKPITE
ncbi:Thioredoxin, partial [Oryctes borbonicus]